MALFVSRHFVLCDPMAPQLGCQLNAGKEWRGGKGKLSYFQHLLVLCELVLCLQEDLRSRRYSDMMFFYGEMLWLL